jgi:hypothetical protein
MRIRTLVLTHRSGPSPLQADLLPFGMRSLYGGSVFLCEAGRVPVLSAPAEPSAEGEEAAAWLAAWGDLGS